MEHPTPAAVVSLFQTYTISILLTNLHHKCRHGMLIVTKSWNSQWRYSGLTAKASGVRCTCVQQRSYLATIILSTDPTGIRSLRLLSCGHLVRGMMQFWSNSPTHSVFFETIERDAWLKCCHRGWWTQLRKKLRLSWHEVGNAWWVLVANVWPVLDNIVLHHTVFGKLVLIRENYCLTLKTTGMWPCSEAPKIFTL